MEAIELRQWKITTTDNENFGQPEVDESEWREVILSSQIVTARWMRQSFKMLPNDSCTSWWLEIEPSIRGQLWVNGQYLGELGDEPLEITLAVAIGTNVVAIRLEDDMPRRVTNVPRPCQ